MILPEINDIVSIDEGYFCVRFIGTNYKEGVVDNKGTWLCCTPLFNNEKIDSYTIKTSMFLNFAVARIDPIFQIECDENEEVLARWVDVYQTMWVPAPMTLDLLLFLLEKEVSDSQSIKV